MDQFVLQHMTACQGDNILRRYLKLHCCQSFDTLTYKFRTKGDVCTSLVINAQRTSIVSGCELYLKNDKHVFHKKVAHFARQLPGLASSSRDYSTGITTRDYGEPRRVLRQLISTKELTPLFLLSYMIWSNFVLLIYNSGGCQAEYWRLDSAGLLLQQNVHRNRCVTLPVPCAQRRR